MTRRVLRSVTAGALIGLMLAASRHLFLQWGSRKSEARAWLPGDDLVPDPSRTTTRAVTVSASADDVWRWLVQIGQDRGGMYSYDWIENVVGLDIHSAREIRPEWQHLTVGDEVRLVPKGWCGLKDGYVLSVAQIQPGRTLVLHDATHRVVWSFHIRVVNATTCRLITRGCATRPSGAGMAIDVLMGPIEFVMSRRMLLGIKHRAEAMSANPVAWRAADGSAIVRHRPYLPCRRESTEEMAR